MPERADELLLEIACGIGQVGATAWAVCSLLLHLGEAVRTVPLDHDGQRPAGGLAARSRGSWVRSTSSAVAYRCAPTQIRWSGAR